MRMRALAALALIAASACVSEQTFQARAADPAARPGGTLRVALTAPSALDPALVDASDASARLIVGTMCDTLVQLDPVTADVVPGLAESWTITDAGKRLTLRLREGARFHDGSELTSDDVAFSLSRLASEETAAPAADILRPVSGFADVHGETIDGGVPATELDGVTTIDKLSLEIKLDEHRADFLRVLSHPATAPVPKALATRDPGAIGTRPVCVGPYRAEADWVPGARALALVRADGYDARNAAYSGGGAGYADRIEITFHPSRAASLAAFRAGEADVARVSEDDLPSLGALASSLVSEAGTTLEYIGVPTRRAPFSNRAVRVALSQALDRARIAETVYGGGRVPVGGLLPAAVGARVHRTLACGDRAPLDGDVAAARASLRAAGIELRGQQIQVFFNDEFRNRALLEEVAAQWQDAFGLTAELSPLPWERYLETAGAQGGFAGPFRMAHAPQVPSADAYLFPLLESSGIGQTNLTGFADREFDRSIDREARRASEEEDRGLAYQALEDIGCEQLPVIPLVVGAAHHLLRDTVASAIETAADRSSGDVLLRELYLTAPAG